MAVPLKYNLRSLRLRWRATLVTVACIALTVAVFVIIMALAAGLEGTYLSSGDPRNLLVIRKGALAESSSQITFDEARRTRFLEGIARDSQGEPLHSAEVVVLITLERHRGGKAHVQIRGLGPMGLPLRPPLQFVEGRMFKPGLRECVVSRSVAGRFKDCALGQRFHSGKHTWTVAGVFDARQTAYASEIWMDADEAREAFNRAFYCSILLRPADPAQAADLALRIEADRHMRLRAMTETDYYREQIKTAGPIRLLGYGLALIMGLGAAFSAMNTMYAAVGARFREVGELRVLGFRPRGICISFMAESVMLALAGGMLGCALALPMHGLATGTFNWKTFAEAAFEFRITPSLLLGGMLFALVMGLLGGLLPARLAIKQTLLEALRG